MTLLIAEQVRERINVGLENGAMVGGWLLTGPPHIGKNTLAMALAKTVLSQKNSLGDVDPRTARLVTELTHPDLFVLTRKVNEKTGRLKADIVVEDVRELIRQLHQTSSTGYRVAIVDSADDLNRAAANALLKILEEPPAKTLMLLLSAAPGRLLPTIKSRCRRLALPPLPTGEVAQWLADREGGGLDKVAPYAAECEGRPGRALSLMKGEGETALTLADQFFDSVARDRDLLSAAKALADKKVDDAYGEAIQLILDRLGRTIRYPADAPGSLSQIPMPALLSAHETLTHLSQRAEALNSDRTQTVMMMELTLRNAMRGR